MRPSTSFDLALIRFSELIHIKLTSYDLRKTHHGFSHQGLFCDSSKFGYGFKTLYNKFERGSVSNEGWSADHGLQATDTFASLVDTLALITRRVGFLKGGRAAATVNVSKFRRDMLCLCSKSRVAKCGCRLFEARQEVRPAPHESHRNNNNIIIL
jgi:hypothetical protein